MLDIQRSQKRRYRHDAIQSQIDGLESLYSSANLKINSSHQLFGLLNDAKHLSSEWAKENVDETDMNLLFSTLHVGRIYDGTKFLSNEKNKEKYLKDLLNGSLNFFERKKSHAKDIFWELEAFTKIKNVIDETYLEEPDIVVNINHLNIAIPCKKTYSEKGVPKVLSNAVAQIERKHEFGIVAMNIDDLIPEDVLLKAETFREAGEKLHSHNMEFINRNERHFLKYLSKSRIVAVVASTSAVTDTIKEYPKFSNFSQWTIWTIPDLKPNHKKAIDEFRRKVVG